MLIGHCSFGTPDAALLVSLLPDIVLVRDRPRLATLIQLIGEETRERRAARGLVLERLLEVLLIEALRSATETSSAPGLKPRPG
ncbi:Cupin [Raoultella terrigena]|uniref:Cupin n=1 Tax=Raoultella terrigena TaxID=577 RepID=A0A4U9D3T5_RAOTE|nr:Cupin [Raoultella terrigena]